MNEKKEKVEIETPGEVLLVSTNQGTKNVYGIFEQLGSRFLHYEQGTGLQERAFISKSTNQVYKPLQTYPFPALEQPLDYCSIEELFKEIKNFIYEHVDFPHPACYDIVAAFIMVSWRAEDFETVPYLLFLGDICSGKTRSLEVLEQLCYRALASASISPAAVVRLLQSYRTTLLIDETELFNHESRQELVAILNSGYKRGQFYARAKQDSEDVELWHCFGPKALAGTQDFARTLNSRCVLIPMERAGRSIRKRIDSEKALHERRKLLDYRFKALHTTLPALELPFKNGRHHELFEPLLQVVPESARESIIRYGLKMESDREIEDATSLEGDVLLAIVSLKKDRVRASDILEFLNINGDMTIDMQNAKQVNSMKNRIGRILRSKFHLQKNTQKQFFVDKEKIERLTARYLPYLLKRDKTDKTDNPNTNELSHLSHLSDFQKSLSMTEARTAPDEDCPNKTKGLSDKGEETA